MQGINDFADKCKFSIFNEAYRLENMLIFFAMLVQIGTIISISEYYFV